MATAIVVGAGIAGLGAAYTLQKHGVEVSVLEAGLEVGGRMRSREWRGVWIDVGGESLSTNDKALLQLVSELGIYHRKQPYYGGDLEFEVWRNDREHDLSYTRPSTFLTSGAFGLTGRLRLVALLPGYLRQAWYNRSSGSYEVWRGAWADDESVETWLSRVNPSVLEYFVEPLFEHMCSYRPFEISKGWFLYNMVAHQNLSLVTFDEGLGLVPRTLAKKVDVTTDARVTRVVAGKHPVLVEWEHGGRIHRRDADAVLVAVPGTKVMGLVDGLDRERIRFFERVRYSPHELAYFALSREMKGLPAMRFYPRKEAGKRDSSINSIIYDGSPTNPDVKLLRVFMKADHILRHFDKTDDEDLDAMQGEAARYFPDAATAVENRFVARWREAVPIFDPGYIRRLQRFVQLPPLTGVSFAGDYLASCTTGAAYTSGQRAAIDLLSRL